MLDTRLPLPTAGRTFAARRRVRLADMDRHGRLRLDAVARFLQDTAIDDVQETGWGIPEHLWFVRRIRLDVIAPFLDDREIELVTWCSGLAAIAAGRRWSVTGDRDGKIEVDSVWIHLGPDQRPSRIEDFDVYAAATGGRSVSTKLGLPDPPSGLERSPWPLRATDVDVHGHVNNAVYWQAVEHRLAGRAPDLRLPHRALLDYREPVDLADEVDVVDTLDDGGRSIAFLVGDRVSAVARIEQL
ncbi:MAG: acyl-ACP thioesterase domain-containing protein [Gaiellaceae bacterium]